MFIDFLQIVGTGEIVDYLLYRMPSLAVILGGIGTLGGVFLALSKRAINNHRKEMLGPNYDGNDGFIGDVKKEITDIHECLERIEKDHSEHLIDEKETMLGIKTQIESIKMDISKDLRIQLNSLTEKSVQGDRSHLEFKKDMDDQKKFFIDWIQRIEDLLRDERFPSKPASRRRSKKQQ